MPRYSRDYAARRVEDLRGSASDRRARKRWILETFGDGGVCPCTWCGALVSFESMHVDRFPVCGRDGGRYVHENIVPACPSCNLTRCQRCGDQQREAVLEATIDWSTVVVDEDGRVLVAGLSPGGRL